MRPVDREVIERDDKWVWDIFHRWSNVPLAQEKKYIEEVRREKVQEENNPGSWKDIWNQAYKFLDEEEYKDTMNVAERWVRELEKLGKEMERSAKAYTRDRESQEEEDMTELDVYERLLELNRTSSTTPPQPSSSPSTPQQLPSSTTQLTSQQHPAHQATVTSTLTTTERITLPDGSVTTKMMLKKRFADGREESSETVHTENGNGTTSGTGLWQNDEHWDKPSQNDAHRDKVGENRSVKGRLLAEAVNKPVEEKRKGGWFWS